MSLDVAEEPAGSAPVRGYAEERAFASEAAHRLRNPLTALRLRLEELGSCEGLPADLRVVVDDAISDADRVGDELTLLLHERVVRARARATSTELGPVVQDTARRWSARLAPHGRGLQVSELPATGVHVAGPVLGYLLDAIIGAAATVCRGDVHLRVEAAPAYVRFQVRFPPPDLVRSATGIDDAAISSVRSRVTDAGGRLVIAGGRCGVDVLLPRARAALV